MEENKTVAVIQNNVLRAAETFFSPETFPKPKTNTIQKQSSIFLGPQRGFKNAGNNEFSD